MVVLAGFRILQESEWVGKMIINIRRDFVEYGRAINRIQTLWKYSDKNIESLAGVPKFSKTILSSKVNRNFSNFMFIR